MLVLALAPVSCLLPQDIELVEGAAFVPNLPPVFDFSNVLPKDATVCVSPADRGEVEFKMSSIEDPDSTELTAYWFIDYDPTTASGAFRTATLRRLSPDADLFETVTLSGDELDGPLTPNSFHTLELVVSDGIDGTLDPPNRTPRRKGCRSPGDPSGCYAWSYRWTVKYLQENASCTGGQ